MKWEFQDQQTSGKFCISIADPGQKTEGLMTIVLNTGDPQDILIDQQMYIFPQNCILPLAADCTFTFSHPENLTAWQFDANFYAPSFLFSGGHCPLFVELSGADKCGLWGIGRQCIEEINIEDGFQSEMLRALLKRLIIRITRIVGSQPVVAEPDAGGKFDLFRKFNLLVEANFRKQHRVDFYARAMCRSPKTLVNLFGLSHRPPPSTFIHSRIIREAKHYLCYTDKSAKEVALELGFLNASHFSRFFKTKTGVTFSTFRDSLSSARPRHDRRPWP